MKFSQVLFALVLGGLVRRQDDGLTIETGARGVDDKVRKLSDNLLDREPEDAEKGSFVQGATCVIMGGRSEGYCARHGLSDENACSIKCGSDCRGTEMNEKRRPMYRCLQCCSQASVNKKELFKMEQKKRLQDEGLSEFGWVILEATTSVVAKKTGLRQEQLAADLGALLFMRGGRLPHIPPRYSSHHNNNNNSFAYRRKELISAMNTKSVQDKLNKIGAVKPGGNLDFPIDKLLDYPDGLLKREELINFDSTTSDINAARFWVLNTAIRLCALLSKSAGARGLVGSQDAYDAARSRLIRQMPED